VTVPVAVGACDSWAPAGIGLARSVFNGVAGSIFVPVGVSAALATRKFFTSTS
jgi:hypothetical protein